MPAQWTVEQENRVRALWSEGLSAAQIASELDAGFSRSSVLGKAFRMGLPKRRQAYAREKRAFAVNGGPRSISVNRAPKSASREARDAAVKFKPKLPVVEIIELPPDQSDCAVTFLELGAHTCRWPLGEGIAASYCGAEPARDKPYCTRHCRIAYRQKEE